MQQLPRPPEPQNDSIFVLGMHRSGTSAVARVLNLMGAYVGEDADLMPPHARDNPTGYWERRELVIAHDEFLAAEGYAWDRVSGFEPARIDAPQRGALLHQLRDVVRRLSSHAAPWLIKDPRLCLLLPIWLDAAPQAACVVVVRDPRQVAASMRESHRGVYTSHFLLALWEKYLYSALQTLSGRHALFVSYAQLLSDADAQSRRLREGLQELGCKGLHAAAPADLHAFVDAGLRRSTALPHMELSTPQRGLFAWLEKQCDAPGPVVVAGFPQTPAPDAVLREFERTLNDNAQRARAAALGALAEQQVRLLDEVAAQREQLDRAHAESADLRERISLTAVHVANLEHIRSALEQRNDTLTEQTRALEVRAMALDALERRHAEVTADAELQRSTVAQLRTQLHEDGVRHQADMQNLQAAHEGLSQHAKALEQGLQAVHNSLSWKISAPLRGFANLLALRLPWNLERALYRLYYGLPGISTERKQKFIESMHRRAGWLTRNTLSHKMHAQVAELREQRAADPAVQLRIGRMDRHHAEALLATMQNPPRISIVMPVYNVEKRWLLAAVESVRKQFYPHWELCIVDDASTRDETRHTLAQLAAASDPRIKIRRLDTNVGIAAASDAALDLATGDYVGLLDNDDELSRDALIEMAQRIIVDDPDLLYSDEDKLDEDGRHVEPHFKPDFSPDYFLANNYVCHFSVVRRELLKKIGGFRAGFDGAQDFDLLLRVTEHSHKIVHIPKILYHWRKVAGSTAADALAKPKSTDAGRRAVMESLARRSIDARVDNGPFPNTFSIRRRVRGRPRVSIVVPFRDKPELLRTCVESILAKSTYAEFEIVGVDNNSQDPEIARLTAELQRRDARVRFLRFDEPFNYSAINNFAARQTSGEHLLLLNNDTEVLAPDWIEAMLEHSQRPEVGAVGAKLLYPDGTLQHAGVVIGLGGVAGHPHLFLAGDHPGYFARAQLTQNMSAVTFACAMTRRAVFDELGGLNETNLTIAFNDVDYCLRAREAGYLVVYTPNAVLHHHESKSRGYEDNPEKQRRFAAEADYIRQRHAEALRKGDPYYNPNLSLMHAFVPADDYVSALPVPDADT